MNQISLGSHPHRLTSFILNVKILVILFNSGLYREGKVACRILKLLKYDLFRDICEVD